MWLKDLKIAVIEKNITKLNELMSTPPSFKEQSDIDEALSLINEAKNIVISLKNDTEIAMSQIKKNIKFLNATEAPSTANLDITL